MMIVIIIHVFAVSVKIRLITNCVCCLLLIVKKQLVSELCNLQACQTLFLSLRIFFVGSYLNSKTLCFFFSKFIIYTRVFLVLHNNPRLRNNLRRGPPEHPCPDHRANITLCTASKLWWLLTHAAGTAARIDLVID